MSHRAIMTLVWIVASVATLMSCQDVDDTIGANIIPENQQMRAGYLALPRTEDLGAQRPTPRRYIETRLYQTDTILSSNVSSGYMGVMYNDTLGSRKAGFLSQYTSYYQIDSGYFGYRPIFDSAQLKIAINSYGKDTTSVQEFAIYEITTNDYLKQKPVVAGKSERDTTFYIGFDPEHVEYIGGRSILSEQPLFTFTLGGENGPVKEAVTLKPTAEGKAFVRRLMLLEGKYKGDYTIYKSENLEKFIEEFKGLYIKPMSDPQAIGTGSTRGTVYGTALKSSGMVIFGRNRLEEDPTLIKDTIGISLNFVDTYQSKWGNVSINSIDHDYSTATATEAAIDLSQAHETNPNRPEVTRIYVEGLGGIITEVTLGEEFFKELERTIEEENKRAGQEFRALAFNQALMTIYFPGGAYDWEQIDTPNASGLINAMNDAPERLGMYTDYKQMTGIPDYDYVLEQQYNYTLAYNGYINRSHGCYAMNVTGFVQDAWNHYLEAKVAAGLEQDATWSEMEAAGSWAKIEWTKIKDRSIYLGPEAYDMFTSKFTILQGQSASADGSIRNDAPIRLEMAYNLIK